MPTALITGAGRGIGLTITERLAGRGWNVIAGARSEGHLEHLATITGVRPIKLDITKARDVEALTTLLPDRLDALVNNAGRVIYGPVEAVPIDELAELRWRHKSSSMGACSGGRHRARPDPPGTTAGKHADIVGFTGMASGDAAKGDSVVERIEFVHAGAGNRFDDIELNPAILAVPTYDTGLPDLSMARNYAPHLSDEHLLRLPTVLSGSTRDIADTLRSQRESYGLSYFTVQDSDAESFAGVNAEVR